MDGIHRYGTFRRRDRGRNVHATANTAWDPDRPFNSISRPSPNSNPPLLSTSAFSSDDTRMPPRRYASRAAAATSGVFCVTRRLRLALADSMPSDGQESPLAGNCTVTWNKSCRGAAVMMGFVFAIRLRMHSGRSRTVLSYSPRSL